MWFLRGRLRGVVFVVAAVLVRRCAGLIQPQAGCCALSGRTTSTTLPESLWFEETRRRRRRRRRGVEPRLAAARASEDEPFAMVRDDLKAMKQRIRALVERTLESDGSTSSTKGKDASALQSHPLLQEAAREFFERRERAFRPAVVILVARALPLVAPEAEASIIAARQCLLAEIVEMMSTAQIIHDTVLEEDDDSALGNVAHRVYSSSAGNKVSVLAGDFLLARCSVALSQLGDLRVVELMAAALENMVHGNVLRRDVTDIASYEEATRLKTSSLVANACLSAAVLAGHHPDSDLARAVYAYADELGLAYQTVADVIIFDELSKNDEASRAHLLDFLPPVVYAPKKGNVQTGLRHALDAAKTHANNAISSLDPLPPSAEKLALLKMVDYVSERDQRGLQREKYIASAASPPRPATAAP